MDKLEWQVLKAVRDEAGMRVCRQAIRTLQQTKAADADHERGIYSLWESICFQVQVEESYHFDLYRYEAEKQIYYFVEKLPEYQRLALWLNTNYSRNWGEDFEPSMDSPDTLSNITQIVWSEYLLSAAESWATARFKRTIDRYHG